MWAKGRPGGLEMTIGARESVKNLVLVESLRACQSTLILHVYELLRMWFGSLDLHV